MSLRIGYNTDGFGHHRLDDALEVLADIGFQSVAITLDHMALNPLAAHALEEAKRIRRRLHEFGLMCVVETGARFLLDPRRKHWPTLLTADASHRRRRLDFLLGAIEIAEVLEALAVGFWSGAADADMSTEDRWRLLADGCAELLDRAGKSGMILAFEPEPGMFVESMEQYRSLANRLNHPRFKLTLDVGHVHCLQDGTPEGRIGEFAADLANIHIEDMRRGIHEHLMFGEGEIDFPPIFRALRDINYNGPVNVELSRHSHDAVNAARRAFDFLSRLTATK